MMELQSDRCMLCECSHFDPCMTLWGFCYYIIPSLCSGCFYGGRIPPPGFAGDVK